MPEAVAQVSGPGAFEQREAPFVSELCSQQRFELPGERMGREDVVYMGTAPSSLGIALLPTLQLCALLLRAGNVTAWGKRELWVQSRPCSSFPSLSFAPLRTPHPCPVPHVRCGDRSHPPKAITGGSR